MAESRTRREKRAAGRDSTARVSVRASRGCPGGFWQRLAKGDAPGPRGCEGRHLQKPRDVPGQGFGSPEGLRWLTLLFSPSSPGRDPPVRRLQPAHPGQVHPQGAGPALAQLLPQVRRLPHAAGRALLLPGRQRLLQGGFLQVSSSPQRQRLPARRAGAQLNFEHNFSQIFPQLVVVVVVAIEGDVGALQLLPSGRCLLGVNHGKAPNLPAAPVPPLCWCSGPRG